MSAFHDLSTDDQRRLEEAAGWRLRLARDPSLEQSSEYIEWSADLRNISAREAVGEAWSNVGALDTAPEILELRQRALTRLRQTGARRWGSRKLGARFAAAILIVGLFGGAALYMISRLPSSYETDIGERRIVALPDGSHVSMDSDSKVRVMYYKTARTLTLDRGRARFDVAHDPNRPFTVTAGPETVVAVGTSFNVERLQSTVLITLIQGQIVIKDDASTGLAAAGHVPDQSISLKAGEQLVVPRNLRRAVVTADLQVATAWETGHLVFRDELLSDAVARVNRYIGKPVIVDPSVAPIRISGVFNAGDVGSFVSAVTSYFPVQASTTGNNNILLQPRS
jgi:transmembrane sensor